MGPSCLLGIFGIGPTRKKNSNSGRAINPLLTTSFLGLMTGYWPSLSLSFFIELSFFLVHKNAKMNSVILLQIVVVIPGTHLVKTMILSLEPLSPSSKNVSKIENA